MPTIKRFANCAVEMYNKEHGRPHFHVIFSNGDRCSVDIVTLEVLAGEIRPSARLRGAAMGRREPGNAIAFLEGGKSMKPPRIEEVRVLPNKVLSIRWTTGETLNCDLSTWITETPALASLADDEVFAKAHSGLWGHSVAWDTPVDLGADNLYELCKSQAGYPSPSVSTPGCTATISPSPQPPRPWVSLGAWWPTTAPAAARFPKSSGWLARAGKWSTGARPMQRYRVRILQKNDFRLPCSLTVAARM